MDSLLQIQEKIQSAYLSSKRLEEDYENKTKGEAYMKRYQQIRDQIRYAEQSYYSFGKIATIIIVKGIIRDEDNNLLEQFEIFYTNISLQEAEELAKSELKNVIKLESYHIPTGKIMTNNYVNLENRKRN